MTKLPLDWKMASKEGNISVGYDKQLAKNVISINGTTSASNYIQVPPLNLIQKKPLGLTGKYVSNLAPNTSV